MPRDPHRDSPILQGGAPLGTATSALILLHGAGVIALSGALLGPEGTPREYEGSLAGTPVFLGTGDRDTNIPKRRVDEAATVFEQLGAVVTKQIYSGLAHAMNEEEKARARAILSAV